jgi:hypothetical protein
MKEKHIGKRSCAINFRWSLLISTLQFDLMVIIYSSHPLTLKPLLLKTHPYGELSSERSVYCER